MYQPRIILTMTMLQLGTAAGRHYWSGDTIIAIVSYLGDTIVTRIVITTERHGASHFPLRYCNNNNPTSLTISSSNLFWAPRQQRKIYEAPPIKYLSWHSDLLSSDCSNIVLSKIFSCTDNVGERLNNVTQLSAKHLPGHFFLHNFARKKKFKYQVFSVTTCSWGGDWRLCPGMNAINIVLEGLLLLSFILIRRHCNKH